MQLTWLDALVFVGFFVLVVVSSIYQSREEKTSADYFLAGRSLPWWMIGFSIVAANISTEQIVGMAGQGAGTVGLAVSSWQLMGSACIVLVAFYFLPRFLQSGIFTMPEYLEYRYHPACRSLMAIYTMVIYVGVTITAVLYSGALTLHTIFDLPLATSVWIVGLIAAVYTTWGGLRAVAFADLFQGSGLLVGGLLTTGIGLWAIGGWGRLLETSGESLHMILPADHPDLPWTAVLAGMWIPNFYYTGLNQFIVQRTLGARNLRQGQMGILFAASLWLLVPFAIVLPGIISSQLYGSHLQSPDQAYPMLIRNLIPVGVRSLLLAFLAGAVVSSLASMLNSASTIFTLDLYRRRWRPQAGERHLVWIGRLMTVIFVLIGCWIAPQLGHPRFRGVFNFIQEFQGYISPGILAAFIFGFAVRRAPAAAGLAALLVSAPLYGLLQWQFGHVHFLLRMGVTFGAVVAVMAMITWRSPLPEPWRPPAGEDRVDPPSGLVLWWGTAVIAVVAGLFVWLR
jgi:SSS family solute:Na+ symporter